MGLGLSEGVRVGQRSQRLGLRSSRRPPLGRWRMAGSVQNGCTEVVVVNLTLSNSLKSEKSLRTYIPEFKHGSNTSKMAAEV